MRKKGFWFLLLIPIMLLTIASCDLDTLSNLMGGMGDNAYAQAGWVTIDTSHGEAISGALGGLQDLDTETEDGKAAYQEGIKDIKQALGGANTEQKKQALKESLSAPLTSDIPDKVNDAIGNIATDLDITIPDPTTEGDLVVLVLLTEVYEAAKDIDFDTAEAEELIELLSDALLIIDTVKDISPAGSIDLDSIIGELLGNEGLFDELFRSSRSTSREEGDDDKTMAIVESLFNAIINSIGTTGSGIEKKIDEGNLNRALANFAVMRVSYEIAAKALAKAESQGREIGLGDITNYIISVAMTEADNFLTWAKVKDSESVEYSLENVLNEILQWQEAGKNEDTPPAFIEAFEDSGIDFEEYLEDKKELFEEGTGTVVVTLENLASAIAGGDIWVQLSSMFD